jgi:hypothetical protein
MLISDLEARFGLEPIQGDYEDRPLLGGYCSDLLSDVMAHAKAGSVLVTIQAHRNSVAVASLVGLSALILCNGRQAPLDMVEAARAERLSIFGTIDSQFEVSGKLWAKLSPATAPDSPDALDAPDGQSGR